VAGGACALTAAGAAYCRGSFGDGPIGDGIHPTAVLSGQVVTSLSFSGVAYTGCAVISGGSVQCWLPNPTTPFEADGGVTFSQVSSGWTTTWGLTPGGALYSWNWQITIGGTGPFPVTPARGSHSRRSRPAIPSRVHSIPTVTCGATPAYEWAPVIPQ
jgi:hypothetical protein